MAIVQTSPFHSSMRRTKTESSTHRRKARDEAQLIPDELFKSPHGVHECFRKIKLHSGEMECVERSWHNEYGWQRALAEIHILTHVLADLQGQVVPRVLNISRTKDARFAVAQSLPHTKAWRHADSSLSGSIKRAVLDAYAKIHERGVLHNDVQWHHINIGLGGFITITSFERAQCVDESHSSFVGLCTSEDIAREKRKVKFMLDLDDARRIERERTEAEEKRFLHNRKLEDRRERVQSGQELLDIPANDPQSQDCEECPPFTIFELETWSESFTGEGTDMDHLRRKGNFDDAGPPSRKWLSKAPVPLGAKIGAKKKRSRSTDAEAGSPPRSPTLAVTNGEPDERTKKSTRSTSPPASLPLSMVAEQQGLNAAKLIFAPQMSGFKGLLRAKSMRKESASTSQDLSPIQPESSGQAMNTKDSKALRIANSVRARKERRTKSPLGRDAEYCQISTSAHVVVHPLDAGPENWSKDPEPVHDLQITRRSGTSTLWKVSQNCMAFVESFLRSNKGCRSVETPSEDCSSKPSSPSPERPTVSALHSDRASSESSPSSPRKRKSEDSDDGSPTKRQREETEQPLETSSASREKSTAPLTKSSENSYKSPSAFPRKRRSEDLDDGSPTKRQREDQVYF